MNKRRRTSSVASRGTEDDGDDIPPEPMKRRKKLDPVSVFMCFYFFLFFTFNVKIVVKECSFLFSSIE